MCSRIPLPRNATGGPGFPALLRRRLINSDSAVCSDGMILHPGCVTQTHAPRPDMH